MGRRYAKIHEPQLAEHQAVQSFLEHAGHEQITLVDENETKISLATYATLKTAFQALVNLSQDGTRSNTPQRVLDANDLLLQFRRGVNEVPANLALMSQKYSLSLDGQTFTPEAVAFANIALKSSEGFYRLQPESQIITSGSLPLVRALAPTR